MRTFGFGLFPAYGLCFLLLACQVEIAPAPSEVSCGESAACPSALV